MAKKLTDAEKEARRQERDKEREERKAERERKRQEREAQKSESEDDTDEDKKDNEASDESSETDAASTTEGLADSADELLNTTQEEISNLSDESNASDNGSPSANADDVVVPPDNKPATVDGKVDGEEDAPADESSEESTDDSENSENTEETTESEENEPRYLTDANGKKLTKLNPLNAGATTKGNQSLDTQVMGKLDVNDLGEKPNDFGGGSWGEFLKRQWEENWKDKEEEAKLQAELAKKEKEARISKAIAAVGDIGSSIANLWGAANWGVPFKQKSTVNAIQTELEKTRDRYTKNINTVRERLRKGQESYRTALHYKSQEENQAKRNELEQKKLDRQILNDEIRYAFEKQKIELRQAELDERIERYAMHYEWLKEKYGRDYALRQTSLQIQRDAEDRRKSADERKAVEDAEKKSIKAKVDGYDRFKKDAIKAIFGSETPDTSKLSDEDFKLLTNLRNASNSKDREAMVNEAISRKPELKNWGVSNTTTKTDDTSGKSGGWSL